LVVASGACGVEGKYAIKNGVDGLSTGECIFNETNVSCRCCRVKSETWD
jgi:hypothetical protein